MSLSTKDKTLVKAFWDKASKKLDDIGSETLSRMLITYPATKTYFAHWDDLKPGSAPIRKHGKVIMKGLATAVSKIDDLESGLSKLAEIHATKLKVDPTNFKILSHCILVVLSKMFWEDFTPETHVAMDKFLSRVSQAMSEKYR